MSAKVKKVSIAGEKIRKYRELMGWSQDELAEKIKRRDKQTISAWETGKRDPSLKELIKLAEVFNATVAQLIGEAPMFEEPRENYVMMKKDDLIELQRKALEMEEERIKDLKEQLDKALGQAESGESTEPHTPLE
ncbi:helix-turn-helix transcriptional regulator [Dyadobacter aurulentus]|uniref:helix-turn-helix transcriptional regulator n=1 Tax=Dyadobacter sp. UC 10 TaxID=2605428 RepID=UPI001CEC5217|nr:helix-turn-helix transcriptional regulator [Dyadobacter sp. UC 10]